MSCIVCESCEGVDGFHEDSCDDTAEQAAVREACATIYSAVFSSKTQIRQPEQVGRAWGF